MASPVPAASDVSSGTYKCTSCGYEPDLGRQRICVPCPSCGNGEYGTVSGGDGLDARYPNRR